jgi:hypothetical protein
VEPTDPWNRTDERALINLLPPELGNRLIAASQTRPDLFGLEESSLRHLLRREKKLPTATDNRLRMNFWAEYDLSQTEHRKMKMSAIVGTICIQGYFYQKYLQYPEKCAWLVCRPASYETLLEEGLAFGLDQLRDVLAIPHLKEDQDGNITGYDTKLIEIKAKIVAMFDQRVKGAVVQRIEQKTMALNMNVTNKKIQDLTVEGSMEEIDKRIKELERRDRKAQREITHEVPEE